MAKFFKNPFALSGDKTTIPEPVQGSGDVSFVEGFGFDYERDLTSDPLAKAVPRDQTNYLFNVITEALKQYQTNGFPDFITTADNGGTPYSYDLAAYVRYDDGSGFAVYESIASSNTSLPTDTTKWRKVVPISPRITGEMIIYEGSSSPSGWVFADGKTIGNASSGATGRANADTEALFLLTWNSFPNSVRPIQDSTGTASTRGISAAADFAANKRLPIRDMRGYTAAGLDNLGGTAANRITNAGSGINGDILGANGGAQNVTLSTGEMPSHSHAAGTLTAASAGSHSHTLNGEGSSGTGNVLETSSNTPTTTVTTSVAGAHTHSLTGSTGTEGSGQAHLNMQPTTIVNYIIKL